MPQGLVKSGSSEIQMRHAVQQHGLTAHTSVGPSHLPHKTCTLICSCDQQAPPALSSLRSGWSERLHRAAVSLPACCKTCL